MFDLDRVSIAKFFEPSQPDITPRSDVVVPDREGHWLGIRLGQGIAPFEGASPSPRP